MIEMRAVETWLDARLRADATLNTLVGGRFVQGVAPASFTYPFVSYTFISSRDRTAIGAFSRILTRPLYQVKCILKVSTGAPMLPAYDVSDRIDETLVGAGGTITVAGRSWQIGLWEREEPIAYEEPGETAGTQYLHVGGNYRTQIWRA